PQPACPRGARDRAAIHEGREGLGERARARRRRRRRRWNAVRGEAEGIARAVVDVHLAGRVEVEKHLAGHGCGVEFDPTMAEGVGGDTDAASGLWLSASRPSGVFTSTSPVGSKLSRSWPAAGVLSNSICPWPSAPTTIVPRTMPATSTE